MWDGYYNNRLSPDEKMKQMIERNMERQRLESLALGMQYEANRLQGIGMFGSAGAMAGRLYEVQDKLRRHREFDEWFMKNM